MEKLWHVLKLMLFREEGEKPRLRLKLAPWLFLIPAIASLLSELIMDLLC